MPVPRAPRHHAPVLRRGPGELQFGTDPRWAVRVVGLAPEEERWLQTLGASARHAPLDRPTPPVERRESLLRLLDDAGVLVGRRRRRRVGPAPGGGEAELAVLDALRADGAGHRVLAARARAVVGVVGLGRIGASLATTLATSGIGTLTLHDPAPVLASDVGLGGFRLRDVGASREVALRRSVEEVAPGIATCTGAGPDVVVVVEHRVADPVRLRELVGDGVPHLSVVVREADVLVGPYVRPGLDPCVRCLDLHRQDADPCWPQVSHQLREAGGAEHEEAVLASVAAAVAAGQVLTAIDGSMPRTATACIEIAAPDAVPRLRGTSRHPACGCGDLTSAPPDGTPLAGGVPSVAATGARRSGDGTVVG
ncbi:ThiF family adenylyltransferase [Cellulosimicrobium terreum]|nr:ThiF family adenylyltransferase [Cellulosimicrobium terreum]